MKKLLTLLLTLALGLALMLPAIAQEASAAGGGQQVIAQEEEEPGEKEPAPWWERILVRLIAWTLPWGLLLVPIAGLVNLVVLLPLAVLFPPIGMWLVVAGSLAPLLLFLWLIGAFDQPQ